MSRNDAAQALLGLAMDMMGGLRGLSVALGVSVEELEDWLSGRSAPPPHVVNTAADLASRKAQLQDTWD